MKIPIYDGVKKTYNLTRFREMFQENMKIDSLYLGYYLHLIQDIVYRKFVYTDYQWNPKIPGNIERLYHDYQLINYPFGIEQLKEDLREDFIAYDQGEGVNK